MYGFTVGQKSWDQHPIIDIKVDIEGHELDALPEWIESGALEILHHQTDQQNAKVVSK